MSKKNRTTLDEKMEELKRKLEIFENSNFVEKGQWAHQPDSLKRYKNPNKAKISNWKNKEDFYSDYKNSSPKNKEQLYSMTKRVVFLNENHKETFFKKVLSKKNFLLTLWITSIFLIFFAISLSLWIILKKDVEKTAPVYLLTSFFVLIALLLSFYFLFKQMKILYFKNSFYKNYFGKWYSFKNPKFEFSKEKELLEFLSHQKAPDEFEDLFSHQDWLNFQVLFFREYFFFDGINPNYKYKMKFSILSIWFMTLIALIIIFFILGTLFLILAIISIA
ncbi:unknown; predicted coding region [Mycoplasmopsis pulmonis]|uniref:Uncharacterized protein n=1 Tax=Mycoplasmopsis pulmonis (strain UAB CTIP) TaxID=272635 RepID=Q98QM7_MYCPU|nr:hypothetical protein [Mycoplasmopsis pulmonis]MDZ7293293.1 hypothetical protein [Mycoplasmopsis pulmonis]CAC13507.1 unknown; predicted coding region [Mycoplasmopsis pulmonis]VEU68098.1 Uncharacterised protein [Mycoplasmopsis pulmonis]